MKKYRTFFLLASIILLFCAGCAKGVETDATFPNKDLVQGLIGVNQHFLTHSQSLSGDVVISAVGKGSYEGSNLKINLRSSNEKNSVVLSGNVSSQTVLYLIDTLAATKLQGTGINIDLVSLNQEYQVGNTGNMSAQYVTLNEDVLTPFLKTNALYFETYENQVAFAKMISRQIIATDTEVIRDKGVFTTYTFEIQAASLAYILPFNIPNNNQKTHMRIVQNQQTKEISHLSVVVYEDKISNGDQTLEFDIDISLQFDMRLKEGKNG